MNVSSIVVQTKPERKEDVLELLKNKKDICDVYYHDEKGRIVVTIEGESIEEEIKKLRLLQDIPHVVSADMVYSFSEEELDAAKKSLLSGKDAVPEMLNDDTINAKDIIYHGNLKKKHI